MRFLTVVFLTVFVAACGERAPAWGIAMHGGARNLAPGDYSDEELAVMRREIARALSAGHRVLAGGGTSLDAVQAAVVVLEDSPWYNAGRGAVFTNDGRNELDASLMDGRTLRAGAVAALHHVKNPIVLARAVMEKSAHVMMVGDGAEVFAREQDLELVDERYFRTERRWRELQKALEKERGAPRAAARADYFGTVGAVALDQHGNLAAATSTGGMTNKRYGRVGDSPIVGAGTYADNRCGAISATGHGEFFIRHAVAHDICARALYGKAALPAAADTVITDVLGEAGGDGGVIAMDPRGTVSMPFNTTAMFRGYAGADGVPAVAVTAGELARP